MMQKRILVAIGLAAMLFTVWVVTVGAVPPVPFSAYGNALYNGEDATIGAEVIAYVDGTPYASTTVTDYGGDSVYALLIPGDEDWNPDSGNPPTQGKTITFTVDGALAGQTTSWDMGNSQELNLTASGPAKPEPLGFTPNGGTALVDQWGTLVATYEDYNGANDIRYAGIVVNNRNAALMGLYARYNNDVNKFELRNNAGTAWLTCSPGNVLTTDWVALDCDGSSIVTNGQTMTVTYQVKFLKYPTDNEGTNNVYLEAYDQDGLGDSPRLQFGTLVILKALPIYDGYEASPQPITVGTPAMITITARHGGGWDKILAVNLRVNVKQGGAEGLLVFYNQGPNLFAPRNESVTGILGTCSPGDPVVLSHPYMSFDCANSKVLHPDPYTTQVVYAFTPLMAFSGHARTQHVFVKVADIYGNDWPMAYRVGPFEMVDQTPQVGTFAAQPSTGSLGTTTLFTTTVSDPDGWRNIRQARVLINTSLDSINGIHYRLLMADPYRLYLVRHDKSFWADACVLGSDHIMSTPYVEIDCSGVHVDGIGPTGQTLTLTVPVRVLQPLSGSSGPYNVYLEVQDRQGAEAGFTSVGTWGLSGGMAAPPPVTDGRLPEAQQAWFDAEDAREMAEEEQQLEAYVEASPSFFPEDSGLPPEPTPTPVPPPTSTPTPTPTSTPTPTPTSTTPPPPPDSPRSDMAYHRFLPLLHRR